jgi:hypothetical protein
VGVTTPTSRVTPPRPSSSRSTKSAVTGRTRSTSVGDSPWRGSIPRAQPPMTCRLEASTLPAGGEYLAAGQPAQEEAIAQLRDLSPPADIEADVESLVSALEADSKAPRSRQAPHRQVTLKRSSPPWTMRPRRRRSWRTRQMSSAAERATRSRRAVSLSSSARPPRARARPVARSRSGRVLAGQRYRDHTGTTPAPHLATLTASTTTWPCGVALASAPWRITRTNPTFVWWSGFAAHVELPGTTRAPPGRRKEPPKGLVSFSAAEPVSALCGGCLERRPRSPRC